MTKSVLNRAQSALNMNKVELNRAKSALNKTKYALNMNKSALYKQIGTMRDHIITKWNQIST